MVYNKLFENVA